jgi:hypothetical protein
MGGAYARTRATTKGLDTTLCDGAVVVPPFELTD